VRKAEAGRLVCVLVDREGGGKTPRELGIAANALSKLFVESQDPSRTQELRGWREAISSGDETGQSTFFLQELCGECWF